MKAISNVNIERYQPLITPRYMKEQVPLVDELAERVVAHREAICDIVHHRDSRWLLLIGPCSIHDYAEALEFGSKLAEIQREVEDKIMIVMRVYFEKPRTTIGWRGLIFDPDLNGSYNIPKGLHMARKLLFELTQMNLAVGSEVLDPVVPQYIDDLLCWGSIGARTSESQTHRELASGLSIPIGFKNSTDGHIQNAVDAIFSSSLERKFIGITIDGTSAVVSTKGNKNCHLILRGGRSGGNYHATDVGQCTAALQARELPQSIMIDCNHANSQKDFAKQIEIAKIAVQQRHDGLRSIIGCMIESNLKSGNQPLSGEGGKLKYGVSVTDPCLGWDESRDLIQWLYEAV